MAIPQRQLNFTFTLGTGQFGTGGSTMAQVSGLRASVQISGAGGPGMVLCTARIFGLSPSIVNQLSTLGQVYTTTRKNSLLVTAGTVGQTPSIAFFGTIYDAWVDANAMPDVPFIISAQTGFINAVQPCPPTSIQGTADIATVMSGLATFMGLKFENNGVVTKMTGMYYSGSAWTQAQQIVHDAGLEWNAAEYGVLSIWNPGQGRDGDAVSISAETGMIGFPTFTSRGVNLRTVYNPTLGLGKKIAVQSMLKPASQTWSVCGLDHFLESMVPKGKWETAVQAASVGLGPAVPS